jgi:hypothetical protein
MKCIFSIACVITLLLSCNQGEKTAADNNIVPLPDSTATVKEDSLTIQLRTAIRAIETQELQQMSTIKYMMVENITYQLVSTKDYFINEKASLQKNAPYSSNKEKTTKALQFLDEKIASATSNLNVYKVNFHLNAQLANTTKYDEMHTRYLKEDLSALEIIFP